MTRARDIAVHAFAWTGGALFVVSLTAGAYLYLVILGATARDDWSPASVLANVALFSLFALHHSVMARSGAKAWLASWFPARLERSLYVWVSSLLFVAVCVLWQPIGGVAWRLDGTWQWLGFGLQAFGLVLTALGARVLDPLELAGIAQVRATADDAGVPAASAEEISDAGPYGLVRHPIYLGWFLMVFFAPHMTADRLVFAIVSSAYLLAAIPWEERSLEARHGTAYVRYRQKVRWRVVPGIY
jgi:methanethiol S-methyltransferase